MWDTDYTIHKLYSIAAGEIFLMSCGFRVDCEHRDVARARREYYEGQWNNTFL
jgi:hypothetical protein